MSYSLNSLKGVITEIIVGERLRGSKGDIRSLDYNSHFKKLSGKGSMLNMPV